MSQDFFKRITNIDERNKILFDFVHSQNEILTKIDNQIYKFKPFRMKAESFTCLAVDPLSRPQDNSEHAVHSFFLGGEKYFFKGTLSVQKDVFEIFFNVDLFHLQRRQSYRIRIPASYNSLVKIMPVGLPHFVEGKMQDLSAGGCAAELKSDFVLKLDDPLQVEVWLKNKKVFETPARVKYVGQPRTKGRETTVSYGLEFAPKEKFLEQKVFALTVELYRELYAKVS